MAQRIVTAQTVRSRSQQGVHEEIQNVAQVVCLCVFFFAFLCV